MLGGGESFWTNVANNLLPTVIINRNLNEDQNSKEFGESNTSIDFRFPVFGTYYLSIQKKIDDEIRKALNNYKGFNLDQYLIGAPSF